MLNENGYRNFNEQDFVCDPDFQDWIINRNEEKEVFWKKFFEANPNKKEAGENARKILVNIKFREELPDASLIESSFAKHLADIERLNDNKVVDISTRFPWKKVLRMAAVFGGVLLVISALLIFNKKDTPVLVKTEFGNIKSIILPDSSSVVLNGNSTIKFSDNWGKNDRREVWLEGEAFFDIRHINKDTNKIKSYEQFIVHTEDLTVEVLGTAFDIRQRRGKTEVVLETGRIKVSFADGKTKEMTMKPGDKLTYYSDEDKLITGTTEAENFSAWKEKKLLLDDPTAAEVIEYLEDVFGKKLVLANAELGKKTIEGPIQITNLDDALFVLSTVLDAEIIRKDSTVIIKPR